MHVPVFQKEVIVHLKPGANKNFIDCTFGEGGHTLSILEANAPKGKVLAIERTPDLIAKTESAPVFKELIRKKRLILVNDNFVNLKSIVQERSFENVSGVLLDLGLSMWHIKESGIGFSFQQDEPLIMRYDKKTAGLTAAAIINEWRKEDIADILKKYGEEKFANRIAQEIVRQRKKKRIYSTKELVQIIKKAIPVSYQRGKIHFATKTFQGLRIAVNEEIENLKNVLPQARDILNSNGRLVTISFHSLEDRIVKHFLKEEQKKGRMEIITLKPLRPTDKEIENNISSRSARLRAAIKK